MQATKAEIAAPARIELILEWNEALRKASAARMIPTVTRTAVIAETIASRDRRVRTSQFFRAPREPRRGVTVPPSRGWPPAGGLILVGGPGEPASKA